MTESAVVDFSHVRGDLFLLCETMQTLEIGRGSFLSYFNHWSIWLAAENALLTTRVISFASCWLSLLMSLVLLLLLPAPLFLQYLFNCFVDIQGCPWAILGWLE